MGEYPPIGDGQPPWQLPPATPAPPAADFAPGNGYAPPPRTNGLAVASLVLGIASLVTCAITGVPGLITGIMAKRQIRESRGAEEGDGLALGGIVTSSIGLGLTIVVVLAIFAVTFLGRTASSKFSSVGSAIAGGTVTPSSRTPATTAMASAAGKPCVATVDPLPAGAPAVDVVIGPAPTTLVVKDLKEGTGAAAGATGSVTVAYIGVACSTGKIFDSSYTAGRPVTFPLAGVIPGFAAGITGMKVGGQRLLGIPSDQAYGSQSPTQAIGPNEALWFVVELVAVA